MVGWIECGGSWVVFWRQMGTRPLKLAVRYTRKHRHI